MIKYLLLFCIIIFICSITFLLNENFKDDDNKILKLEGWFGRLGNNIITLSNALHIALDEDYSAVIFPSHSMFNKTYIKLKECDINSIKNIDNKDCYDIFEKSKNENKHKRFQKNKNNVLKHLTDIFNFNYKDISKGKDNDLYIHIRSGDLFEIDGSPSVHFSHTLNQPLLNQYIKLIDNSNYDNIFIIAEDKKNPVINQLLNKYPKIIHNINSFEDDIKLILGAKNIAFGDTTLIPTLLYFNKGVKNVYYLKRKDRGHSGDFSLIRRYTNYNLKIIK